MKYALSLAAAVAVLALAPVILVGCSASNGSSTDAIPARERSDLLDTAKSRGVIEKYRVVSFDRRSGSSEYEADGEVRVLREGGSGGEQSGRTDGFPGLLLIQYVPSAAPKAKSILELARASFPGQIMFDEVGVLRHGWGAP